MKMRKFTVEVHEGPSFRAGLDVIDLANELMELIPEWHISEREESQSRINGLAEIMLTRLRHVKKTDKEP